MTPSPLSRPLLDLQQEPADRVGEVEDRMTGALRMARDDMKAGLQPKVVIAGEEMNWFKEGNSHFLKEALPTPPTSSFDLESVSKSRFLFQRSN